MKPVVLRAQARQDVEDAIDGYLEQQAEAAVPGFIDALERAYRHTRYPHLVFYLERDDHIDVWRVLHGRRDIPAWMLEPGDAS